MKKNYILVASCLLIAMMALGQQNLEVAKKQFELGAYDLALSSYQQSAQMFASRDLNTELARCYSNAGELKKAASHYAAFRKSNPSDSKISYGYADVLMKLENYEEAVKELSMLSPSEDVKLKLKSCKMAMENGTSIVASPVRLSLNSSDSDFAASYLPEGIVYNTYAKVDMNQEANKAIEGQSGFSLALSKKSGKPTVLINNLGNRLNIGAISITDSKCAFTRSTPLCAFESCRNKSASIYLANIHNNAITDEQAFPYNAVGISNFDPHLSEDGTVLYFASDNPQGFGGTDLYMSKFDGKSWSVPQNLGEEINTSGNERSPFIHGDVLYFASDLHEGFGGYDLITAHKFGDGWLAVQNMGKGINSSGDDLYPSLSNDGSKMLFTSNRGGSSKEDIYEVALSQKSINATFHYGDKSSSILASVPEAVHLDGLKPKGAVNAALVDEAMAGAKRVSLGHIITNTTSNVFFIQLAAYNSDKSNFSQYRSLLKFGNIYKVAVGQSQKIRLGYFLNEEEARNILGKVKGNGFPDAFIVANPLNTAQLELVLSSYDNVQTPSSTPPSPQQPASSTNTNSQKPATPPSVAYGEKDMISYKVRLASYEDPIWFESNKVKDLGQIEQWSKGFWTIFVLSGYKTFEEAERARISAYNRGYKDAEVVIDNGGIIERIKKN